MDKNIRKGIVPVVMLLVVVVVGVIPIVAAFVLAGLSKVKEAAGTALAITIFLFVLSFASGVQKGFTGPIKWGPDLTKKRTFWTLSIIAIVLLYVCIYVVGVYALWQKFSSNSNQNNSTAHYDYSQDVRTTNSTLQPNGPSSAPTLSTAQISSNLNRSVGHKEQRMNDLLPLVIGLLLWFAFMGFIWGPIEKKKKDIEKKRKDADTARTEERRQRCKTAIKQLPNVKGAGPQNPYTEEFYYKCRYHSYYFYPDMPVKSHSCKLLDIHATYDSGISNGASADWAFCMGCTWHDCDWDEINKHLKL